MLGYVLGRGEGQLGLFLQLVLNGANIALAIVLGLELGWGVAGVAWGAVCGELIGLAVGIAIVWRGVSAARRWPTCAARLRSAGDTAR